MRGALFVERYPMFEWSLIRKLWASSSFSIVTPALVQDTYKFKEYKSRGLLNVGETPALSVLFQLFF